MAFTGLHVLCTTLGALRGATLPSRPSWSETMGSPTTTTQTVPSDENVFLVRATVDAYVAVGATPDASQAIGSTSSTARTPAPAGADVIVFCKTGDKLAWVAA